jgi:hypothetical protein
VAAAFQDRQGLARRIDTVAQGGQLVAVSRDAGIGKTRLVSELADLAVVKDVTVLWGHCSDQVLAIPCLPFIEAFSTSRATFGPGGAECAPRVAAPGSGPTATGTPVGPVARLFEASLLSRQATNRSVSSGLWGSSWAAVNLCSMNVYTKGTEQGTLRHEA